MSLYRVTVIGESREIYEIEADSEAEARENWHMVEPIFSEVLAEDVESVEEAEA